MIKLISALDIITLPIFNNVADVFELVKKEYDQTILDALYPVGVDNTRELEIFPCRHRLINGQQVVHYAYSFWERTDRKWLSSRWSTMDARIEAQKDGELKADMMHLSYDGALMKFKEDEEALTRYQRDIIVETYRDDTQIIHELNMKLKDIR